MSYNLPPISTLSAVLGQDSQQPQLQIAPELLDDPSNQSSHQQESSERNGAHQQWTTESHYQVDESTDDLRFFDTPQPIDDQPPPRKKAKSRASANNVDLANIINEATVAEYEDPAGDWRSGVVYVHPAATANQACVRCHRIKRKCDNARPRCAGCWKADTPCVFEISPATAGLVINLKNEQSRTTNELQITQQRVADLEAQLAHPSVPINHDNIPHQSGSTFPHPPAEVERYYSGFAQTILGIGSAQTDFDVAQSSNYQQPLPNLEVLQLAATSFFDAYQLQYPFLNRGEFMSDLQDIWTADQASTTASVGQRREFVVMMVTSVGAHLCESKGGMENGIAKELRERAMRNLGPATAKTDLITVQAYLALLFSVLLGHHPEIDAHNVLALAMQTAISLNLHRKPSTPSADEELRSSIRWTIYNFDRSLNVSLGRPLGIADSEIDADLPSSESANGTHTSIFNSIVAYRRILSKLYAARSSQITKSDNEYDALEQEIHDWRNTWPGPRDDQSSQTYAQLLSLQAFCLLYRPGPNGIGNTSPSQLDKLRKYAKEALEIYQNSTTSTRDLVTLAWRYQIVIALLYATCPSTDMDHDQVRARIETSQQVVANGPTFKELKRLKVAFEQLVELLQSGVGSGTAQAADRTLAALYNPTDAGNGDSSNGEGERSLRVPEAGGQLETLHWEYLI